MGELKKLFYVIPSLLSFLYIAVFKLINYKRPRVMIYTDSRGFEITKIYNRKTPWNSYINFFVKRFRCDVYICPEKHTTFFDFIFKLNSKRNYKHIVCHVGVVDFSPRPDSAVKEIILKKKQKIVDVFGEKTFQNFLNTPKYSSSYLGEQTASIVHENFIKIIAEKLNKIDNLIWVSCNPVLSDWNGNYKKKRPKNIGIVNDKSRGLQRLLNKKIKVIDLTNLGNHEVKKLTCDNIHLSKKGMKFLEQSLKTIMYE